MLKKILLATVVSTPLIVGGAWFQFIKKPAAPIAKKIQLKGIKGPVELTRDEFGIPHIEGENYIDVMRAFGYVTASDRLFQMDLLRRIATGRLSEVFGKDMVKYDILLRKLKLYRTQQKMVPLYRKNWDPQIDQSAEAFYDGVRQYIDNNPLPLEFKLLGYTPDPFSIVEGTAIAGYMALSFAEGLIGDALISDLMKHFPKDMIEDIIESKVTEGKEGYTSNYGINDSPFVADLMDMTDYFEENLGLFHGSNSWVLSGKRTKSGKPILANDPHIAFSNPSVWYEAHLKSSDFELYGHFIPLAPFPVLGHNSHKAWAITMAEVDDLDLYEEKIDWDQKKVMYKGEWVDLEIQKEIIRVKGEKDVEINVYTTPHGPLLDDTKYAVKGKDLALKWSFHHEQNDVASVFFKLARAKTLEEMKNALALGATPGINISWADKEGNIGWHVHSKIPLRPQGVSGKRILKGWDGSEEYLRYFTIDENPHKYNPKSGVIVTANTYPEWLNKNLPMEGYWQPNERFDRLNNLLKDDTKWTLDRLKAVQNDAFVFDGEKQVKLLLSEYNATTEVSKQAVQELRAWDYTSPIQSIGSALYFTWYKIIQREALIDQLGEDRYKALQKVAYGHKGFGKYLFRENSKWWDDIKTSKVETRKDIIQRSFDMAIAELEGKFGKNVKTWTWGKIHTIEFQHPMGKVKPLNKLFNLGPYPVPGSAAQVNNMGHARSSDNFNVTLGPSTRRLIDFEDPGLSLGIIPTGNSGQVGSPHYSDQAQLFINGEYRNQYLDLSRIPTETAKKTLFTVQ